MEVMQYYFIEYIKCLILHLVHNNQSIKNSKIMLLPSFPSLSSLYLLPPSFSTFFVVMIIIIIIVILNIVIVLLTFLMSPGIL